MVQILPSRTNIGSQIGQGLGTGLAQGMERRNAYNFQRGNLQKALQEVKDIGGNPGSNTFDLVTSVISALSGVPGGEKSIGTILPILLQQMSLQRNVGRPGQEGMGLPGPGQLQGHAPAQGPTPEREEQNTSGLPQPVIPGVGAESKGPPTRQQDISEQVYTGIANGSMPRPDRPLLGEGQAILQSAMGANPMLYSPAAISNADFESIRRGEPTSEGNLMRNYNADVEKKSSFDLAHIQARAAVSKALEEQNQRFSNYVEERNPGIKADDKRVFLDMARTPQAMEKKTIEERYKVAQNLSDRYNSTVDQLERDYPMRLAFADGREKQMRDLSNDVKWMVDVGQRDKAKAILTDKLGFGDADSEEIINPLKPSQKISLTKFKKLTPYDQGIRSVPESDPDAPFGYESPEMKEYGNKIAANAKERNKEIKAYIPHLKAAITKGTAEKPGTSLSVARKYAMDATGMTWEEFNDVIQNMVRDKQIELDPYQRQELPKMRKAPYRGLADVFMDRR